ncbi:hypothetical protein Nepgr_016371 [Nepenthes gracilis]|uniref:GH18 domain-containing protein n=1 Tax=Nepenthes gracilis TaxID=150966 RepID=A0AAD3SPN4_NEPGR|nr:hypothetical protein Nepgr_016371 [Nepenthes gracilis]
MEFSKLFRSIWILLAAIVFILFLSHRQNHQHKNSNLFENTSEHCTMESNSPTPINPNDHNLTPQQVSSIKAQHRNVRVAPKPRGDSVGSLAIPISSRPPVTSWLSNAVSSLTRIINDYNLDGIDIDYEHFKGDKHLCRVHRTADLDPQEEWGDQVLPPSLCSIAPKYRITTLPCGRGTGTSLTM